MHGSFIFFNPLQFHFTNFTMGKEKPAVESYINHLNELGLTVLLLKWMRQEHKKQENVEIYTERKC